MLRIIVYMTNILGSNICLYEYEISCVMQLNFRFYHLLAPFTAAGHCVDCFTQNIGSNSDNYTLMKFLCHEDSVHLMIC